jgi:hypothetical protein
VVIRAVERLLGWFGAAPDDPEVAAGDLFGGAGVAGFVALFAAERGGVAVDGLIAADLVVTAIGVGLTLCWIIARATDRPDPWAQAGVEGDGAAPSLETAPDPRAVDDVAP